MSLEVTSCCACVVALCATEKLLSWMSEHVFLEVTSLCAGVLALCAVKRPLSTMNQVVSFQMISFDAWVAALVAITELLSITLQHMSIEVFSHPEGEIGLNTWGGFVFSLYFQDIVVGWRQQKLFWKLFLKSESGKIAVKNIIPMKEILCYVTLHGFFSSLSDL